MHARTILNDFLVNMNYSLTVVFNDYTFIMLIMLHWIIILTSIADVEFVYYYEFSCIDYRFALEKNKIG